MTRRRFFPAVVLFLVTATALTCGRHPSIVTLHDGNSPVVDEGTILDGRRVPIECPNIEALDPEGLGSAARHDSTVAATLAGSTLTIPEYHDCQRLVPVPFAYGPLVGIFAREALGEITQEQFMSEGGMAVAQIYNFSSIPYGPLGIFRRFSCVYLKLISADNWQAQLIHHDELKTCRTLTARDWAQPGPLRVVPLKPYSDGRMYPPVARWDFARTGNRHFIGVKCLASWCEIGVGNFSSPEYGGSPTSRVKGWYDEQRLAEPVLGSKILIPRKWARVVPVERLDTLTDDHYTCAEPCPRGRGWVHVATAILEDNSVHYDTLMNFRTGSVGNRIYMRRRTRPGDERWETRIISARNDTTFHRTLRVNHAGHYVPPTARWHWREDDETVWVRCSLGCCESSDQKINPDVW
jgi:hypothetical protein